MLEFWSNVHPALEAIFSHRISPATCIYVFISLQSDLSDRNGNHGQPRRSRFNYNESHKAVFGEVNRREGNRHHGGRDQTNRNSIQVSFFWETFSLIELPLSNRFLLSLQPSLQRNFSFNYFKLMTMDCIHEVGSIPAGWGGG